MIVKLIFTMEIDHDIARNNNHNCINSILYSTIKYFAQKPILVISFSWVYSEHEIKKYFFGYFQIKINQGNG
jgi:hypothetical protein